MSHVKRKRESEDCATGKMQKQPYFGDPRLLGRVRQYAEGQKTQRIDIGIMAEYIQGKYSEYARKKKAGFKKSVEKAYSAYKKNQKPNDQSSRLEDEYLQAKRARKNPSQGDVSDSSSGSFSDNEEYVLYKDTNAMNSFLSDMYRKPGTHGGRSMSQPASLAPSATPSPSRYDTDPSDMFTVDRKGDNRLVERAKPGKLPGSPARQTLSTVMEKMNDIFNESIASSTPKEGDSTSQMNVDTSVVSIVSENNNPDVKADSSVSSVLTKTPKKKSASSETDQPKETPVPGKVTKKKSAKGSGKDTKEKTKVTTSTVQFADVGGNDDTLKEVCKLLVHMKHPELYRQLGVTPPQGFLLHGPPGCGKTLLAHAIAGELDLPFIKMAATEVVSGVSGESEEKIRDLFQTATDSAPCVVFLDEIDSITPKRETASKDMERRIVSQLLTCMDELNTKENAHVLVIGATNRPDSLDPALRRAGRFDREIALGIPDENARIRITQVLCRNLKLPADFDFKALAKSTPGFVGADLMALAREAAMVAVNRMLSDFQAAHMSKKSNACDNEELKSKMSAIDDTQSSDVIVAAASEVKLAASTPETQDRGTEPSTDTNITTSTETDDIRASTESKEFVSATMEVKDTRTEEEMEVALPVIETDIKKEDESRDKEAPTDSTKNEAKLQLESSSSQQQNTKSADDDLATVLSWLKEQPPLSEEQLQDLYITMDDFEAALKVVQPSSKREGFATIPDVTWADIGALSAVRDELQMAILAPVRHPEEFQSLGLSNPPGVLLAGPPGCGKTLLAKAIANESGINFISVKGPELLNMYVGESERAVRQVFQRARNSSPCVIFFDELDALCPRRSDHGEGGASVRVVNQLLTEMDGLESRKQVYIMGATNRPDIIDPAILRPGRLDKILYVGLPTAEDRLDILNTITKCGTKPKLDSDVDLKEISENSGCDGYTGADLAALVRESSTEALKEYMSIRLKSADSSSKITEIKVYKRHFEKGLIKVKPSVSAKDHLTYASMRNRIST